MLMPLQPIDAATRAAIARVANVVRVLAAHFVPLTDARLARAYDWAVEQEGAVRDLLDSEFGDALVAAATADEI
jgi:exosome complex component RRP4